MTSLRGLPFALRALFVVVAFIAALAYVISAWQVFGFAHHVWRLPFALCFAAAVVADLLSLSGLFATYLLREAKWHVRAYAWVVFLFMTGLSIAAAESFAEWRRLTLGEKKTYAPIDAQFAAGAIVVALALAVHLLIVCVRHVDIAEKALSGKRAAPAGKRPEPKREPTADKPQGIPPLRAQSTAPPKPMPIKRPDIEKPAGRGRKVDPAEQAKRDAAVAVLLLAGVTPASKRAAAQDHGVSVKSIENWIADYRERHPDSPPAQDSKPQINGVKPQLAEEVPA